MEAGRKDGPRAKERRGGGLRGRCLTRMTHRDWRAEVSLLPCFRLFQGCEFLFFTVPRGAPPTPTNITRTDACELGTPPNWGRCRGIGWEGACTMHRIFEPAINYNLASQRPELGEFLYWCGVQLIVFFLPVRSNVRAEQRPNRGTGCLHVWYCGPSPLELLHNKKGSKRKGPRSAELHRARGV